MLKFFLKYLQFSTENYAQYFIITDKGKESEIIIIYIYTYIYIYKESDTTE